MRNITFLLPFSTQLLFWEPIAVSRDPTPPPDSEHRTFFDFKLIGYGAYFEALGDSPSGFSEPQPRRPPGRPCGPTVNAGSRAWPGTARRLSE